MANNKFSFKNFQMIYACYKLAEAADLDNETVEEALEGLDMMIENLEAEAEVYPGAPDNLNRFDFAVLGKEWNALTDDEKAEQQYLATRIISTCHRDIGFAFWQVPHDRNAFECIIRDFCAVQQIP